LIEKSLQHIREGILNSNTKPERDRVSNNNDVTRAGLFAKTSVVISETSAVHSNDDASESRHAVWPQLVDQHRIIRMHVDLQTRCPVIGSSPFRCLYPPQDQLCNDQRHGNAGDEHQ
jgi:hypothetical protein